MPFSFQIWSYCTKQATEKKLILTFALSGAIYRVQQRTIDGGTGGERIDFTWSLFYCFFSFCFCCCIPIICGRIITIQLLARINLVGFQRTVALLWSTTAEFPISNKIPISNLLICQCPREKLKNRDLFP